MPAPNRLRGLDDEVIASLADHAADCSFAGPFLAVWHYARGIQWCREARDDMRRFSGGLGDETQDTARQAYGATYARLAQLKAKYDPQNLFRMNQNVAPAHAGNNGEMSRVETLDA